MTKKRTPKFHLFKNALGDGWWAHVRGANGRIVWTSEIYEKRAGAAKAMIMLAAWGADFPLVDHSVSPAKESRSPAWVGKVLRGEPVYLKGSK